MAKAATTKNVDKIKIRMYRGGTGDFFLLRFYKGKKETFKMMIDCGCIQGSIEYFTPRIDDLIKETGGKLDLLVVTHEHADHINGFEKAKELFKKISFKKVWFAWTENDKDPTANDYRKNFSELEKALKLAALKLNKLAEDEYYETLYAREDDAALMINGRKNFIESLSTLDQLNITSGLGAKQGEVKPTMAALLKNFNVIKEDTEVEFLEPGDIRLRLEGATGIRFYILGPPKERKYLNSTESKEGSFAKRENKSKVDFAFISALAFAGTDKMGEQMPFDAIYELPDNQQDIIVKDRYKDVKNEWRNIDHDWLYSAGALALRYEKSINNTSLVIAIQFENSERVLLFPGDAELGNWESWHDGLEWEVKTPGGTVKKKADYLLANTVFYKVGHHLSQNGTAKTKGLEMMTNSDLTAMATIDFRKINTAWLNTMPNDLIGAQLLMKTEGKLFFDGEREKIMRNIKTSRVTIKQSHEKILDKLNAPFDDKIFVECEIEG